MTRAAREHLADKGFGRRDGSVGIAGFAYFLVGPVMAACGAVVGRRRRLRFEATLP